MRNQYRNPNPEFKDGFYSGIRDILTKVYNQGRDERQFTRLIKSIIEQITIPNILNKDLKTEIETEYDNSLEDFLEGYTDVKRFEKIQKGAKAEYHELRRNLHVLNLDIGYENYQLTLKPFVEQGGSNLENTPSLLMEWLEAKYPSLAKIYKEVLNSYINGNIVTCITGCRTIIAGIFDGSKEDGRKWVKGLRNLSTDKYIEKVIVPKNIMDCGGSNIKELNKQGFKFPRFKLIYSLYTLTSDLGAHANEGVKIEGKLCLEFATLYDALWTLRMTEDLLIWVKERLRQEDTSV